MVPRVVLLSAALPLALGWWANRRTTLGHTFFWITLAWLAWLGASWNREGWWPYLAVSMTCCAGVAVLGARRPGVTAWHAVVAGLAAVLLLPLAETFFSQGEPPNSDDLRTTFLAVATAVGLLNYLPTRLGAAAVALLIAVACELYLARWLTGSTWHETAILLAGISPWIAWWALARGCPPTDRASRWWLEFRNRFGMVWAWRLREQFHNSSTHRQLGLELTWSGIRRTDGQEMNESDRKVAAEILSALMTRFGLGEKTVEGSPPSPSKGPTLGLQC